MSAVLFVGVVLAVWMAVAIPAAVAWSVAVTRIKRDAVRQAAERARAERLDVLL